MITVEGKTNPESILKTHTMAMICLGVAIKKLGGEIKITQKDIDEIYRCKILEKLEDDDLFLKLQDKFLNG